MNKEFGLVHVYTGNGKGKTTSAVGLALRALGAGNRVCYCHFMKRPDLYGYAEIDMLKNAGAEIRAYTDGHPFFNKKLTKEILQEQVENALQDIEKLLQAEQIDMLIMDEILITVRDEFITEERLLQFIENKPTQTEMVLTGRGATERLMERADYLSRIEAVKHPMEKGINSRKGIEF